MKIALTGASGLIGSRFFDLLKSKYEIIPLSSSYGVDITDKTKLERFLSNKNPALIAHMAAKTGVDSCEQDRETDIKKLKKARVYIEDKKLDVLAIDPTEWKNEVSAFAINVVGTKNLSDYAQKNEIPLIYISTDFVFDGEKNGEYTEEDETNPINWYGQTKLWGEKVLPQEHLITRTSYPYGYKSQIKKDFIWYAKNIILIIQKLLFIKKTQDKIIISILNFQ